MANIDSDLMALAVPNAATGDSRLRAKSATVTLDGTQSNADVMRFFPIHSGATIKRLQLSNAALSGLTSADFGLWQTTDDGGNAVDDDLFDSAQTLASALERQEKRFGTNSALAVATLGQKVWELLGLTEDPHLTYIVGALINTAGSASGAVVLEMEYTP